MGKSTAAGFIQDRGVQIIDTDQIARQLVEPGQPALDELKAAFGNDILTSEGALRRDELARRVFSDPAARHKLDTILHPRIREVWLAKADALRTRGHALAIVIIPLLFETDAAAHFGATICVACSAATQQTRLSTRHWTPEHIEQRRLAQWPVEKKIALSDFVIWTEGEIEVHATQIDRVLRCFS